MPSRPYPPSTRPRRARPQRIAPGPPGPSFRGAFTPSPVYRSRRPAETPLYRVVQHHLETFLAMAEEGEIDHLPSWGEHEFRRYLTCGILAFGFARARCSDCRQERQFTTPAVLEDIRVGWEQGDGSPFYASTGRMERRSHRYPLGSLPAWSPERPEDPLDTFRDRVALITGASRGIGAGLARVFHRHGLKLALCARSNPDAGEIPDDPERVHYGRVDVTDYEALSRFASEAEQRLGPIDLWVNNAGLLDPIGPLREVSPEDVRTHIEVNLLGVFHGTRVYLERLHRADRTGTIVNISSGAGVRPIQGWGAYCAGKAAVDMLTRVTAEEERPHGIRAYALAPGVIETGMQELIRRQDEHEFPDVDRFRDLHASGHLLDAESPAPAILRLAFGEPLPDDAVVLDVRDSPELQDLGAFAGL